MSLSLAIVDNFDYCNTNHFRRGLPMALFSLSALFGTPIGPIVFSWTGTYASWRWIHWSMVNFYAIRGAFESLLQTISKLISFVPSAILVLTVFTQETLPTVIRRRKGFERTSTPTFNSRWQRTRQALGMSAIRPLGTVNVDSIYMSSSLG